MSRKIAPLAIAVLIALSGCQMLGGGGGGTTTVPTPTGTPPSHHELVIGSHVDSFDATISVTRNGETVFERTISNGTNGTYSELPVLEEPGPYTVTINTTHEVVDENLSRQFRIDGDIGNATLVRIGYSGIYPSTIRLPRDRLEHPLAVYSDYMPRQKNKKIDLHVRVWYRGERIADTTKSVRSDTLTRFVKLDGVGVYYVEARAKGRWRSKAFVVTDPEKTIRISVGPQGEVSAIEVQKAYRWE